MKKSRYSESQIISILKQAENGVPVTELCLKGTNEVMPTNFEPIIKGLAIKRCYDSKAKGYQKCCS